MKRFKRRGGFALALTIAAMAVTAVSAASASASQFLVSATGEFAATQTTNQVFTFNNGSVTCTQASSDGLITNSSFTYIENVHTKFSGCSGRLYGFSTPVEVSQAEFTLRANGEADLKKAFTLNLKGLGCTVTFLPKTGLTAVTYSNQSSRMEAASALTAMPYQFSSSGCGSAASNGTLTGSSLWERVGGGSIQWQA
jgi:hypothetical protein